MQPDALKKGREDNVLQPDKLEKGLEDNVLQPYTLEKGLEDNVLQPYILEKGREDNFLQPYYIGKVSENFLATNLIGKEDGEWGCRSYGERVLISHVATISHLFVFKTMQ